MKMCDGCKLVVPTNLLRGANEYGYLCPACYEKWFKGEPPFDEGDE